MEIVKAAGNLCSVFPNVNRNSIIPPLAMEWLCLMPWNIYHSILLQQAVSKINPALNERWSVRIYAMGAYICAELDLDTTARSQLHCIGLPIDDMQMTNFLQWFSWRYLSTTILKSIHMYLAFLLSNSSCLLIPCLDTLLYKKEIWSSPYSCWSNGCREIGINQANGSMLCMGCNEMNG